MEAGTLLAPTTAATTAKRFKTDFYAEGLAAVFDKPYKLYDAEKPIFESISSRAFDEADMTDIIMLYNHSGKILARTSNNSLIAEPAPDGLHIYADLSKSKAAQELHEEISSGLITKMSWAFTIADEDFDDKTRTFNVRRVGKVYDVSAVCYPANSETEISARAMGDDVSSRLEAVRRARKLKLMLDIMLDRNNLHKN
jgi:HK97 family phage prohead protease